MANPRTPKVPSEEDDSDSQAPAKSGATSSASPQSSYWPTSEPKPAPEEEVTPEQAGVDTESFSPATTGDGATSEDQLGFKPYARGLSEFLLNVETKGPLTVSVEGEWGSGKSSFLLILEDLLTAGSRTKTRAGIVHNTPLITKFNPWRHDKDEALWAAFAVALTKQVVKDQKIGERLRGHIRLLRSRFEWRRGWLELLKAGTVFLILTGIFLSLLALAAENGPTWLLQFAKNVNLSDKDLSDKDKEADAKKPPAATAMSPATTRQAQQGDSKSDARQIPREFAWFSWLSGFGFFGVLAAYLIALSLIASKVKVFFSAPLAGDLSKHLSSPDYTSKVSFIEEFHEDFRRVVEAYASGRTIFVFVDDLDRCAVPRAAELMQAINLMISTELKNIVFILGMDREKIAAGLAMKNLDLLPYLNLDVATTSEGKSLSPKVGLQFGYEYIEKFIQVSFRLPKPRMEDIDCFLKSLSGVKVTIPPQEVAGGQLAKITNAAQSQTAVPVANARTTEKELELQKIQVQFSTDSDSVREIAREMSVFLDSNPRRLKQFINIFRLRAFVGYETGALGAGRLTPQQLGKLITIQMRWPVLAARYLSNPDLWEKLKAGDFGYDDSDGEEVKEILRRVPRRSRNKAAWDLTNADIGAFARVSPSVRTIDLNAPRKEVLRETSLNQTVPGDDTSSTAAGVA